MTLLEGLRLYPKAIAWSVLISSCCAMEGYDISLLGNFCKFHPFILWASLTCIADAFAPFNRKFGVELDDGTWQVPARWQTGLSNGAQCGQIIGLIGE